MPEAVFTRAVAKAITILVVDDEEKVREQIRQALQRRGFSVLCARNGVEALLLGGRHPGAIQLLIADAAMPPYMDGVELARALRRQRPGLRVVYLSRGPADPGIRIETKQGKAALLPTPVTAGELIQTVFAALGFAPRQAARQVESRPAEPCPAQSHPARPCPARPRPRRHRRSILMLVPEAEVRMHVARLLREDGYLVLEAATIGEALCISQWHIGAIGLLLADGDVLVRLPAELRERLSQNRPELRILCATACGLPGMPLPERVRRTLDEWGMEAIGGM